MVLMFKLPGLKTVQDLINRTDAWKRTSRRKVSLKLITTLDDAVNEIKTKAEQSSNSFLNRLESRYSELNQICDRLRNESNELLNFLNESDYSLIKRIESKCSDLMNLVKYIKDKTDILNSYNHISYSGRFDTAGGSATEDFTITGVKSTMNCMVMIHTEGATPVSIKFAKCDTDKITVDFSADPAVDHKISYIVY